MRTEVLRIAAERNMFLSPEALEIILSNTEPLSFTGSVISMMSKNSMLVGKDDVLGVLSGGLPERVTAPVAPRNKKQYDISVVPGSDVTGESTCEGKVEDFHRYFASRYNSIRDILRRHMGAALTVEKLLSMSKRMDVNREVQMIGMVTESSITKNGHRMLTVEDETGSFRAIVLKDSPFADDIIVNDEVIGLVGGLTRDGKMLVASEVVRPGVPPNPWEPSDSVASVGFLSDIHAGSHTFLESKWDAMVKWLRENARRTDLDYLVLPGDVVDGIGIFPGQREELTIDDIYKQYYKLAEYLKEIPDHIRIVLQPGNHDACRPAEPQPALSEIFGKVFDSNVMLTGNPVSLKIENRTVLAYHGRSIDDWVSGVQKLTYEKPVEIMKEMLERRHLAPMYGKKTALAPEKKDYLVIDKKPDIFVTGHVHGAGTEEYKGVRLIAASTWQAQTDFQKMHNFNPAPGYMPIVHLGTGDTTMKGF
ncbi:MAG: DNA-directed DNA polymerase II small subunit [Methanomassiliicoccaceae archaeon]|nr:DNA-directed DNA polymerase II small subunit [Methanomassiliicoccaceae archaeon]